METVYVIFTTKTGTTTGNAMPSTVEEDPEGRGILGTRVVKENPENPEETELVTSNSAPAGGMPPVIASTEHTVGI